MNEKHDYGVDVPLAPSKPEAITKRIQVALWGAGLDREVADRLGEIVVALVRANGAAPSDETERLLRKADGVCFYLGNAYDGEPRLIITQLCEEIRRLAAGVGIPFEDQQ